MIDYKHYTYKVIWSDQDQEFVGLCVEFPSLSYLDEEQKAALAGITDLVRDIIVDLETNQETIPKPIATRHYSGKFQVRTTPELHCQLAQEAAEANVSLNRYVNYKLARQ